MWDTEILKIHRHGFILLSFYRLDGKWIIQQKDLFSQHGMTQIQQLFLLPCEWIPSWDAPRSPKAGNSSCLSSLPPGSPFARALSLSGRSLCRALNFKHFFFSRPGLSGHMIPKSGATEVTKSFLWIGHSLTELTTSHCSVSAIASVPAGITSYKENNRYLIFRLWKH